MAMTQYNPEHHNDIVRFWNLIGGAAEFVYHFHYYGAKATRVPDNLNKVYVPIPVAIDAFVSIDYIEPGPDEEVVFLRKVYFSWWDAHGPYRDYSACFGYSKFRDTIFYNNLRQRI